MLECLRFCLVTDIKTSLDDYKPFLGKAIKGGLKSVQLRAKSKNPDEIYEMALDLKQFLSLYRIPLIINDHIDIAVEIDADGVHVGQSDEQPSLARKRLGKNKIIGLSIESENEFLLANSSPYIDYIAASAVFPSKSKTNLKKIWGLNGLEKLSLKSKYPIIAIGGIDLSNIEEVLRHGAFGIALISALHEADNPQQMAVSFIQKINQGLNHDSK